MFEDGLLYREKSMVNWCCYLQSTISDYEIEHIDLNKPTKLLIPGYDEPVEFGTVAFFSYKVIDSGEKKKKKLYLFHSEKMEYTVFIIQLFGRR